MKKLLIYIVYLLLICNSCKIKNTVHNETSVSEVTSDTCIDSIVVFTIDSGFYRYSIYSNCDLSLENHFDLTYNNLARTHVQLGEIVISESRFITFAAENNWIKTLKVDTSSTSVLQEGYIINQTNNIIIIHGNNSHILLPEHKLNLDNFNKYEDLKLSAQYTKPLTLRLPFYKKDVIIKYDGRNYNDLIKSNSASFNNQKNHTLNGYLIGSDSLLLISNSRHLLLRKKRNEDTKMIYIGNMTESYILN